MINKLIIKWSWLLFFRALFIGIILIVFLYKIIQVFFKKYNISFNIILIESIYNKLYLIFILINWYNITCDEMDKKYIPTKLFKKKSYINNNIVKLPITLFIIGYLINNMFFPKYDLYIIWVPFFFLLACYGLFLIYLDIKYIFPYMEEFRTTDPLFNADGLYGTGWTPKTRKFFFTSGRYGSNMARVCYLCVACILCGNWSYQLMHPNRQAPLEQLGDYMEKNIPGYKDQLDKYTPLKDKPQNPENPAKE